ncbi:MAG: hypothetical protein FWG05_01800, partial [Kiritimatiellaeota bacterium]|nr:hypothetical protein [Kiritimatiellota bacterium]
MSRRRSLLTTHYSLLTTHCSLLITHYSLLTVVVIAIAIPTTSFCRRADIAKLESAEAADVAMTAANEAQRKGDYAKALDLFEAVAIAQPSNALAHLQAALIFQDFMKDDASAIYHLRAYLRLRPDSDKAEMAAERLELAKLRLSGSSSNADGAHIPPNAEHASNPQPDAAAQALARAYTDIADLLGRIQKQEDEINRLIQENIRFEKRLALLGDTPADSSTH